MVHHHHFVENDNDDGYYYNNNHQAWLDEGTYNNYPNDDGGLQKIEQFNSGWHRTGSVDALEFQGSHTLPRTSAGNNKTKKKNRNKVMFKIAPVLYMVQVKCKIAIQLIFKLL